MAETTGLAAALTCFSALGAARDAFLAGAAGCCFALAATGVTFCGAALTASVFVFSAVTALAAGFTAAFTDFFGVAFAVGLATGFAALAGDLDTVC